jgi:hypothetical protein
MWMPVGARKSVADATNVPDPRKNSGDIMLEQKVAFVPKSIELGYRYISVVSRVPIQMSAMMEEESRRTDVEDNKLSPSLRSHLLHALSLPTSKHHAHKSSSQHLFDPPHHLSDSCARNPRYPQAFHRHRAVHPHPQTNLTSPRLPVSLHSRTAQNPISLAILAHTPLISLFRRFTKPFPQSRTPTLHPQPQIGNTNHPTGRASSRHPLLESTLLFALDPCCISSCKVPASPHRYQTTMCHWRARWMLDLNTRGSSL